MREKKKKEKMRGQYFRSQNLNLLFSFLFLSKLNNTTVPYKRKYRQFPPFFFTSSKQTQKSSSASTIIIAMPGPGALNSFSLHPMCLCIRGLVQLAGGFVFPIID